MNVAITHEYIKKVEHKSEYIALSFYYSLCDILYVVSQSMNM